MTEHPRRQQGFTLIELMMVIGVIVALVAMGIPAYDRITERGRINNTRAVVEATATEIANYGRLHWGVAVGASGATRITPLWDANGDGLLDGYVSEDPSRPGDVYDRSDPVQAGLLDAGYPGYIRLVNAELAPGNVGVDGHVLDAWKQPLRLRLADGSSGSVSHVHQYGTMGAMVYSIGPDGRDDGGSGDDISSEAER